MDLFASLLSKRGYTRRTIRRQLQAVAGLSRWLEKQGLQVDDLDEASLSGFEEQAPQSGDAFRRLRAVYPILLADLREIGVIEPSPSTRPDSALDCALDDFSQYLVEQRGLMPRTITGYRRVIRDFLEKRFGSGPILPGELSSADVRQFVLRRAQAGCARDAASALRNFLRSLRLAGEIDTDLVAAVPALATRPAKLPEALEPEQARRLLDSCDLGSGEGLRDYAILLLLARLGLRAGEVVAMRLCDLDWRSGELTVRGKGMRRDRLPILQDVGEALVAYLREGRPECSSPQVFLRLQAPYRGLAQATSVGSIGSIVRRALQRAGLDPRHKGAHLLRHTLATEMLRQGASLREIAQILRHRNTQTTEIYARVDLDALRDLTQPWPGACP
jgi:site-specific recombinase XerD